MKTLMLPYGTPFPDPFPADVRLVGCNMTNPPWASRVPPGVRIVTTADVPRWKMRTVTATIEHAWGLILASHRNLVAAALRPYSDRDQWLAPHQLAGSTIGVIGLGRIGAGVARIAQAFGMRVLWHDKYPQEAGIAWEYRTADSLLRESDIVFIAASGRNALQAGWPYRMRQHSILVSISPAALLGNVMELLEVLQKGYLRSAALDDWPDALLVPEQLVHSGRLIVTPHIGGSTADARRLTTALVEERMRELAEAYDDA